MAFRIEESFQVAAPVEQVWSYLVDADRVVDCLPGAELTETVDPTTFRGRIRIKVGPVTAAYQGTATFAAVDHEGRQVRIEASGQEAKGSGSASMIMESVVRPSPQGGSEVRVEARVEVAGKIVQFGRGMIETISGQLFSEFASCARSALESQVPLAGAESTTETPPESGPEAPGSPAPEREEERNAEEGTPLKLIPLLFRSLMERIRRLMGRGS